jgi:hypothetical protein
MLNKGVLAIILRTISGNTIIISALRELIIKLKKIAVIRGVKLLKRKGVYKKE